MPALRSLYEGGATNFYPPQHKAEAGHHLGRKTYSSGIPGAFLQRKYTLKTKK
jgi:hypothetical protein